MQSPEPTDIEPAGLPADSDVMQMAAGLRTATGRLWRSMRRNVTARNPDLTPTRLEVLSHLERHGPVTVGELADAELMHPSTMTRVIDALEKRGLAVRRTGERDKREISVSLTTEGRAVVTDFRRYEDRVLSTSLAKLSPDDRRKIAEALPILGDLPET